MSENPYNWVVKTFDSIAKDMDLFCERHQCWKKQNWKHPKTAPFCPECLKTGRMPMVLMSSWR